MRRCSVTSSYGPGPASRVVCQSVTLPGLTRLVRLRRRAGRCTLPGHVRARARARLESAAGQCRTWTAGERSAANEYLPTHCQDPSDGVVPARTVPRGTGVTVKLTVVTATEASSGTGPGRCGFTQEALSFASKLFRRTRLLDIVNLNLVSVKPPS